MFAPCYVYAVDETTPTPSNTPVESQEPEATSTPTPSATPEASSTPEPTATPTSTPEVEYKISLNKEELSI